MYCLDNVSFIGHPATGSRSLKRMIMQQRSGKVIEGQHGICIPTIEKSRAVVCVVRNPYDLMASLYWRMTKRPDFNKWLYNSFRNEIGHEDPDQVGGGLFFGLKYATHVIRFEKLNYGYERVIRELRLPSDLKLGHMGKGKYRKGQHYSVLYDEESKRLVEQKYGDLMKTLRYEF